MKDTTHTPARRRETNPLAFALLASIRGVRTRLAPSRWRGGPMDQISRVLVVDDEPQITRVLSTVLASQGYAVRSATDGATALASFVEWQPHLVVTDLYMPQIDGIELCRRIRAMSNVPIIMLSVKGAESAKVEALDAGADDYV